MDACWTVATKSMPADLLPLNPPCLLSLCLSICHTCWYGVSLSGVSAGVVPHYRPRLQVQCLTISHRSCLLGRCLSISHACWCGASLWVLPSGVMPHYQQCLLAWYLNIGYACWSVATVQPIFYWSSADGRRMVTSLVVPVQRCLTSDMSADPVSLSHMPACTVQLYQTCMQCSFIHIPVFVVILQQARHLICYKSIRHTYR